MSVGVFAPADSAGAQWAAQFGLPLLDAAPETGHYLAWERERLVLAEVGEKARVEVDLIEGAQAHRRKFGGGRGQPVAKAVGLKAGNTPTVLDATAGLGRDAFVLATLGCTVHLLERNPVACALLADGLRRGTADPDIARIVGRMQLEQHDARQWLPEQGQPASYDVVYLDPMFPEPDKRARAKKDMHAFQTLIGGDTDADVLLAPARTIARQRVVVKRPRTAPWLAGVKPDFSFDGESTRFDAYLPLRDA
ncbi:class I SAM-dependent methyltransferase [Silvimonas amylolytica]|uniref:Ribosomal RNA small subunit methyltransferase J n=1 Tax=Silvimonas amylolytica TaxID=449663 RepID=A0ABQ2PN56_9NEIS|nr:class I SAM-dependent methyltransferase [Silvimonas amylolytica]GGP26897.1 ribosomal RNA small subunit methyltransferase J [Silvimonas amylolytica]